MRYTSTRDGSISKTFEEAITHGYSSPDGGLFVPQKLPNIESHLKPWSHLSFPELAQCILRLFCSPEELSDDEVASICKEAYRGFNDSRNAVSVQRVGSLYVSELFHGPTFCFKDLGLRPVVGLLSHFATAKNRKTTLLVSTTGDTGPAAVQAVSDLDNPLLKILVHYPQNQISALQRKQLTTVRSPCVRVATFEGGGDDMDAPIKRLLISQNKNESDTILCGVNSYNIARPVMQMVHYVWTYLRVAEQLDVTPGDPEFTLDIVVPTGAMGNITGGYMAKKMGLPIGALCAGVNINDITHRVIESGEFHKSNEMQKTLSEAINIQVPYNFERILFYLTNGNHELVNQWMTTVDKTSKLDLDRQWLDCLQKEFRSARITDAEMCATMRAVQTSFGYLCDPHTAVAFSAAEKLGYKLSEEEKQQSSSAVAILATASPCKFEEAVTIAIGSDGWENYLHSDFPEAAKHIMTLPEQPPALYSRRNGATLKKTQAEWELLARGILNEMNNDADESKAPAM